MEAGGWGKAGGACSSDRSLSLETLPRGRYSPAMLDDLYDRDVLAWSEHQADLLRRVARGERANDIDWEHVAEEIEDVGLSQLNAVQSLLQQILVHLLKLHGWPEFSAEHHWRAEIVAFQSEAERRFTPSMRQRIDLAKIYDRAARQIELTRYGGKAGLTPPMACPVTLDQLLTAPCADLESTVSTPGPVHFDDARG
jgi:hypothetical protein